MDLFKEVYEFAASAGALEGYVFPRKKLESGDLDDWVRNLVKQYEQLPVETRQHFQSSLDRTMGRAVHSLTSVLGAQHAHVQTLKSLIKGSIPESFQDFWKEKEEKSKKYGD
jgi:hypothetical protein